MRSVSVLSSHLITWKEMNDLMLDLAAVQEGKGWTLTRQDHSVYVEVATNDLEVVFDPQELKAAGRLMGGFPRCRVSLIFNDSADQFSFQMAVAVSYAISELWPAVFDDHAGEMKLATPPRRRPN